MSRIILVLLFAASVHSKSTITHEAVWLMKRVGAPVPSPDGRWVVIPVVDAAYDEKDQSSDLWVVPSDASAKPRRITFTKAAESGATWSADSRRIAFSTKRDGDEAAQIYVLDMVSGGEAERVTAIPSGATAPRFSPDGSALAALTALAHASRLAVFRLLIEAGPDGLAANLIATRLSLAPSSLSFHLKELLFSQMVTASQQGRTIIYRARVDTIGALLTYLTQNCCGGQPCLPAVIDGAQR